MIPYARQDINQDDIDAVTQVLCSPFLTQGPEIPAFEQEVAQYCGVKHGVAFNSATSALHIACLTLGLSSGGLLWTSPNSFVASANCALYCGAEVDFVDIDPVTYNMSPIALAKKLEKAKREGRLPDVLVPVHFAGQSCDMRAIHELVSPYGIKIIEDASHAIGGKFNGIRIGSCDYCDITIFSFHPVKIITSAEGGMAMTKDSSLANTMQLLRSHGITRSPDMMQKKQQGKWYYEQIGLGYNYRMTDLQAALGRSQLRRIDTFVKTRQAVAERYALQLDDCPLVLPHCIPEADSAWHLYSVCVQPDIPRMDRQSLYKSLHDAGILVNVHYIPIHIQPWYRSLGFKPGDFPCAEDYYSRCISLPMYASLSLEEQKQVTDTLLSLLAA